MMKILHTSDWHLGHVLYGHERLEEQRTMLDQMTRIVKKEQPDAMVVCGDVYHLSQPSASVQTMLSEALVSLRLACPSMAIVVTAGNHDSGSRHEVFRTPWRALGVHAIGNLHRDAPEEHIIEVAGKGFVVAVPYAHERNIPEGFFQRLLDLTAERNTGGLPVVLTAHTTVRGCDFLGHENVRDSVVGGIDSVDVSAFAEGFVPWNEAKALLTAFPADVDAYVRLNVEVEDFLPPGAFDEAQRLAADKRCTVCYINTRRKEAASAESRAMSVQELRAESPLDLARRYANDTGKVFDDEMVELFEEALRQLEEETRND